MSFFNYIKNVSKNPFDPKNYVDTSTVGKSKGQKEKDSRRQTDRDWARGTQLGTELTGFKSEELGQRNRGLTERIDKMVDQPSLGANRLAEGGAAQLSNLMAQQGQQGVTGGLAAAQQMAVRNDTNRSVAAQAQGDYESAVTRLTDKQKSDAGTFTNLTSSRAALGQAARGVANEGMTYLCTELDKRGLITNSELKLMHRILYFNLVFYPVEILTYLLHGRRLAKAMVKENVDWEGVRASLVLTSLLKLKTQGYRESFKHYRNKVVNYAYRYLGETYSFDKVSLGSRFVAVFKCIKIKMRGL